MRKILKNYKTIIGQIKNYEKEFSKTSKNPKLIAVSKTFEAKIIKIVLNLGHRVFGENKVQEALEKWPDLKKEFNGIELHLIGGLQSNKVKQALEIFNVIQTVDREKIASKIKSCLDQNFQECEHKFFIQVNTGDEAQKNGIKIDETEEFVRWCKEDKHLNIIGLMSIPPINEASSVHFNILKKLSNKCGLDEVSMGMTSDYKEAIQFGSTFLRIGSGIFGKRA